MMYPGPTPMDTEVMAKAKRKIFSPSEKKRILELGSKCEPGTGELGALLRKEGVYTSMYYKWTNARDKFGLNGIDKKRGPVPALPNPLLKENVELKRALAKAEARARRAEALVEVQKKVAELIGIQLPKNDEKP